MLPNSVGADPDVYLSPIQARRGGQWQSEVPNL